MSVVTLDIVVARKIHGVNSRIYANTGPERPFAYTHAHTHMHTHRMEDHSGYDNAEVRVGQPSLSLFVFQFLTAPDFINQTLKFSFSSLVLEY